MIDGLKERHRDAIIALLAANDRVEKAVLFGSRAMGTGTDTSDVDIALFGDRLSLTDQVRLAAAIDEIPMAQSVDLVLHRTIDHQPLLDHIRAHGIEWYRRPEGKADTRLHLHPKHRRTLEALVRKHLPGVEVWAYGSRVNGDDGSDLDLALRGPDLEEIPAGQLGDFEKAVRESTIPFLIEARDWARLPERFHQEIERDYVVMNDSSAPEPERRDSTKGAEWYSYRRLSYGRATSSTVRLGDVADLLTGFPFKSEHYVTDSEAPRLLRGDNVAQGRLRWHGAKRWSAETATAMEQFWLREGDVVLAMDRPWIEAGLKFASVRRSDLPTLLVQRVARLRGGKDLDIRFLKYVIACQDFSDYVLSVQTGTAVPHISSRQIENYEFYLPPLRQQRAIAHILGTLDDKIELNRRMNETLEAMARAIFKDWFVDFGPTRAKMEGREPYLPPEIWNLFPDALDEEGKPEGWQSGTLDNIALSSKRPVSPADVSVDTPYIGLEHMPRRSIALTEWEGAGKVTSNKTLFEKGDLLFGKLRPYFHKVGPAPVDGICSTDIAVVTPKTHHWSGFLLSCLSSDEFVNYTDQTSTGTKMPRTSWTTMGKYEVCFPSENIVYSFQNIIQSLIYRLSANIHEIRSLSQLRDLLLSKLISGEIRLTEAPRGVEVPA